MCIKGINVFRANGVNDANSSHVVIIDMNTKYLSILSIFPWSILYSSHAASFIVPSSFCSLAFCIESIEFSWILENEPFSE